MSLGEELRAIDVDRAGQVFDDIFLAPFSMHGSNIEQNQAEFMMQEIASATAKFPVFNEIKDRYGRHVPELLKRGLISEDRVSGVFMGIALVALVMSGYDDRELPDTLPPEA